MAATLALAQRLIRERSVTPQDGACQAILRARLEPLGFRCETFAIGGVTNLWARRGEARPLIVFAGHTDVVPPGPLEQWVSDPFTPSQRDGKLFGRGAADMKSSLAAFVVAIENFIRNYPNPAGSIGLLFTSDEEGPARDGTAQVVSVLKDRGERIDYCLVGEPTSVNKLGDMIKNGRRGSLSGKLTVKGVQGHVAYPHLADNPIHRMAPALAELATIEWDQGNDDFPPTTFQVSNIHAGTGAGNVIPGEISLLFNFRHATASTVESLKARMRAVLDSYQLDYEISWQPPGKPYLTPRGKLVEVMTAAIRAETGLTPEISTTGGTSDGRFIAEIAVEVVEFGPINMSIHKINEHINVADMEPLAAVYRRTLEALLT